MSIDNGYLTLKELKEHLDSTGTTTELRAQDKRNMEIAIEAISRLWDDEFDTNFYGSTETRYFTPGFNDLLYIDDLISVTTLKTDDDGDGTYENTWATTDYILEPRNVRQKTNDKDKRPYRQIRRNINGDFSFPTVQYGVEIAGVWGYTTGIVAGEPTQVPSVVKQGVLLMSHRIFKRKDAIFGIAGTPALGVMVVKARITEDTDIMQMMSGVDRRGFYS